jgi:biopolymer transport protein ExbB/TolQ
MELDFWHIWGTMSPLAKGVALLLVGMALGTAYVSIERILIVRKGMADSATFARKSRTLLEAMELDDLRDLAKLSAFETTPLARLTLIGVSAYLRTRDQEGAIEFCRRELERKLDDLAAEARRGMGFLATVGSTAPFVGLFGTVIGIIVAFTGIASSGGGGLDAVSAGIAEALIVTAVGLVVAIASVWVFNYLNKMFDKLDMAMQHAAGELLDHLEMANGRPAR